MSEDVWESENMTDVAKVVFNEDFIKKMKRSFEENGINEKIRTIELDWHGLLYVKFRREWQELPGKITRYQNGKWVVDKDLEEYLKNLDNKKEDPLECKNCGTRADLEMTEK